MFRTVLPCPTVEPMLILLPLLPRGDSLQLIYSAASSLAAFMLCHQTEYAGFARQSEYRLREFGLPCAATAGMTNDLQLEAVVLPWLVARQVFPNRSSR